LSEVLFAIKECMKVVDGEEDGKAKRKKTMMITIMNTVHNA